MDPAYIRPLQGRGTSRKAGGGLGAAIPGAVILFAPALGGPGPNDRRRLPDPNAVGARRRQARPGRPGGCVPWQGGKDPGQGVGAPFHQSFTKFYLRIILKMLYYIYTNKLSILII